MVTFKEGVNIIGKGIAYILDEYLFLDLLKRYKTKKLSKSIAEVVGPSTGYKGMINSLEKILSKEDFQGILRTTEFHGGRKPEDHIERYELNTKFGNVNIHVDEVQFYMESVTDFFYDWFGREWESSSENWSILTDNLYYRLGEKIRHATGISFSPIGGWGGGKGRLVFESTIMVDTGSHSISYKDWNKIIDRMAFKITTVESLLKNTKNSNNPSIDDPTLEKVRREIIKYCKD